MGLSAVTNDFVSPNRAFVKWFEREFGNSPELAAAFVFQTCWKGPADAIVWEYVNKTGDKTFTEETFTKAANLILQEAKESI
jgi:hypothetical protein